MYLFEVKKPEESNAAWDHYKLLAPGRSSFPALGAVVVPVDEK
jgi:hypothetical protein